MRALSLLPVLGLFACGETGVLSEFEIPTVTLTLESPTYGAFAGDGPAVVRGKVSPRDALVHVEGKPVPVGEDGRFEVRVPFHKPYRNIDVSAEGYDQRVELRVPVFRGHDPIETWPGAITLRLTPRGLEGIGAVLEAALDQFLSGAALSLQLPAFDLNGWQVGITGIRIGGSEVDLGAEQGAVTGMIKVVDVRLELQLSGQIFGQPVTVPGALILPRAGVGGDLTLDVDDQGSLLVGFTDPEVAFEAPELELFGADLGWLADLLSGAVDLETLLEEQLTQALGTGGGIPIAGPIAFETDALGMPLAVELVDALTDAAGIGIALGVGLGGPVPEEAHLVPLPPGDFPQPVDLAVGVHDGLLQAVLSSDLLALLDQDLTLPGIVGGIFDPMMGSLPGGWAAPAHEGWCIRIQPGDARVAHFGTGDGEPFAGIYLPDARVTFSTITPGTTTCVPWLATSLAMEVLLDLTEGTKLGIGVEVPEGVVLEYGATITAEEEEQLVAQLGGLVTTLLDLAGGFTSFDLSDLLGGLGGLGGGQGGGLGGLPLDGLALEIRDARPMFGANGAPLEGMVELGVQLFPAR